MRRSFKPLISVAALSALVLPGCVERTVKIRTEPPQALVLINDEEVGLSPVKFSFLWYGDYDITIRKTGYEMIKMHQRIDAFWWQFPPIDLIAEAFTPATLHDDHELPTYTLTPTSQPNVEDLVNRSEEMRSRTRFGG